MAEKLTKRAVDRLIAQADPERDTLVWDAGVPGLALRLRSGSARFVFQYKRRGRTQCRRGQRHMKASGMRVANDLDAPSFAVAGLCLDQYFHVLAEGGQEAH
jgi:hypothetical protein